jgi:hypothetical protein
LIRSWPLDGEAADHRRGPPLLLLYEPGKAEEAHDLTGLGSLEAIRRIVEIALFDVLDLENSIARARVLISGALAAAKLLETGELADRIAALEGALAQDRALPPETLF